MYNGITSLEAHRGETIKPVEWKNLKDTIVLSSETAKTIATANKHASKEKVFDYKTVEKFLQSVGREFIIRAEQYLKGTLKTETADYVRGIPRSLDEGVKTRIVAGTVGDVEKEISETYYVPFAGRAKILGMYTVELVKGHAGYLPAVVRLLHQSQDTGLEQRDAVFINNLLEQLWPKIKTEEFNAVRESLEEVGLVYDADKHSFVLPATEETQRAAIG